MPTRAELEEENARLRAAINEALEAKSLGVVLSEVQDALRRALAAPLGR